MAPGHRDAFQNQKRLIETLRRFGGPSQREVNIPASLQTLIDKRRGTPGAVEPRRKVGRNELCPCGAGRKYKQCHGR
ncbi:SEC-C metal-binding domain-containing protein [Plastoroseomonas arctica]|uniref:SEC-C metal-binding domain-containing protein n=1 Tax=Plastoroseomonas arctica TaxID=1509237 RepID=UPI001FE81993|nr:SEC-C metal-binding domain-containing protein [Plastoroseomonas arctica]